MNKAAFVIILILTGLWGCSPYRITQNQTDNAATWSAYQTFAFVDTNRIEPTPYVRYQAAVSGVKQAVIGELISRGYQQTSDNPDLLVSVGTVVNEKTQTRPTTIYEAPLYTGQRRYQWQSQEVPVGTYEEGSVRIRLADAQRDVLVWDATVASVLSRSHTTPAQLSDAVRKAFEKFPGNRALGD